MLTPHIGITGEWGWPLFRRAYKGRRYVSAPFAHMEGDFPDLVLIDGRYRVACALETARRAADAGATATLMLDDYEERPNYQVVEQYLGSPARVGKAAIFIVSKPLIPHEAVECHYNDPR